MSTYSSPSVVQEFIQSNSIERIGEWGGPTTPAKPWLEFIWMPFFFNKQVLVVFMPQNR